jgi:hypothetical protein
MDRAAHFTASLILANLVEVTIGALAELILEMVWWQSKPEYLPLAKDDLQQHQGDITLASSRLGWWMCAQGLPAPPPPAATSMGLLVGDAQVFT